MGDPVVREYRVSICDPCMKLDGQECHTPGCIFFLCSMPEVRNYLSRMLLRVAFGENDSYTAAPEPEQEWCDGCDGTGLMEGWNRRDGFSCPKCKGASRMPLPAAPKKGE